jgi:hypothetical protein
MKILQVLAAVHYGNYKDNKIVDDKCPCCDWDPAATPEAKFWLCRSPGDVDVTAGETRTLPNPTWRLGEFWAPGCVLTCGGLFQILHCPKCGLVYATHFN